MSHDLPAYAADVFRGNKVHLRRFREDDLTDLDTWWNDPQWMILQSGRIAPLPEKSTTEVFRTWNNNSSAGAYGFSIESIDTRELVGHVTIWGIDPVVRSGTLAIIIGGEHVGQGYGTDAMQVMLRFVFEELGFRVEGTRRDATFHAGRYWDEIQMGILRSEYLESR